LLGDNISMHGYPGARRADKALVVARVTEILLAVAFLAYLRVLAADTAVVLLDELIGVGNLHTVTAPAEGFLVTHQAWLDVFQGGFTVIRYAPGSRFVI